MSRINFADLANERPDLAEVWDRFAQWVKSHPNKRIIDPKALARNLRDVSADDLVDACIVMVQHGILRQVFMIEAKNGQLVGQPFDSPLDIPDTIQGSFADDRIDTSDAHIVPVFIEEKAG